MEKATTEEVWIPVSRLRNIVEKLKDSNPQDHITFEFLMASCFPTILISIQKTIHDKYTEGYIQGLKEGKNAITGNN